jgi:hypothetical protein
VQGDVSWQVVGWGEEWSTYGWGGGSTTSYSTNNYLLNAAGIKDISGAEEDGSIIGSAEYVLGEGGVEDIMDWVGVISTYI